MEIGYNKIVMEQNVGMKTSDGAVLRANVYRPDDNGRHPAILIREPYSKDLRPDWGCFSPHFYALAGFAVVLQDVRGTGVSDGHPKMNQGERLDGCETIQWVAAQPWCDGQVSMMGLSYYGSTQVQAAQAQPEHLTALAPFMPMGGHFRASLEPGCPKWYYKQIIQAMRQGRFILDAETMRARIQKMEEIMSHAEYLADLPEREGRLITGMPEFPEIQKESQARIDHLDDHQFWVDSGWEIDAEKIQVPCLFGTGWYDGAKQMTLELYQRVTEGGASRKARECSRLIIGPWPHGFTFPRILQGIDFGQEAAGEVFGMKEKLIDWNRYWSMEEDTPYMREAPVQLFLLGANEWRGYSAWPPNEAESTPYYMVSGGKANTRMGDGRLTAYMEDSADTDTYRYDPMDPTPGSEMVAFIEKSQEREDTLVYTSAPMAEELNVTGVVCVTLYARTSTKDTDFFCRLSDVDPDGRAMFLTSGMVRARYRKGYRKPEFLMPGEIYPYEIPMSGISNLFRKGHCIRVDIVSSSFPEVDRNHNTGDPVGCGTETVVAEQTIYHSRSYPSHINLPVISEKK